MGENARCVSGELEENRYVISDFVKKSYLECLGVEAVENGGLKTQNLFNLKQKISRVISGEEFSNSPMLQIP